MHPERKMDNCWNSLYRLGIVAPLVALVLYATQILLVAFYSASEMAQVLMPLNGLLWIIWWLMVSRGLIHLAA